LRRTLSLLSGTSSSEEGEGQRGAFPLTLPFRLRRFGSATCPFRLRRFGSATCPDADGGWRLCTARDAAWVHLLRGCGRDHGGEGLAAAEDGGEVGAGEVDHGGTG